MKTIGQKERRRAPRITLRSAFIDVYPIDGEHKTELRGKICDVSTVGAKFISNKPYMKDSEIYVGLLLPSINTVINISGRVVRCEKKSSEEYHIAIEFKEERYQQSLLEEYIRIMKSWDKQWERH